MAILAMLMQGVTLVNAHMEKQFGMLGSCSGFCKCFADIFTKKDARIMREYVGINLGMTWGQLE